jgi:hypothetical protein
MMRLQEALNTLDPMDREVLSLRHFEEMSLAETALSLGIEESAAAKRYVRALKRLKAILFSAKSSGELVCLASLRTSGFFGQPLETTVSTPSVWRRHFARSSQSLMYVCVLQARTGRRRQTIS